jgi:rubredoxin
VVVWICPYKYGGKYLNGDDLVRKKYWCPVGGCGKKVFSLSSSPTLLKRYQCVVCRRKFTRRQLESLNRMK